MSFYSKKVYAALAFGELVRRFISGFQHKPQLFITGHCVGGLLAQIVTYTIKHCCLDALGRAVDLEAAEKNEFGINTFVFDAPPAFKTILRSVKAIENPLTERCFNMPIINFISDLELIKNNPHIGPHVGIIIALKDNKDLATPTKWRKISKVSVHALQRVKDIRFGKSRVVAEVVETQKISLSNFTKAEVLVLHVFPFLSSIDESWKQFIPEFKVCDRYIQTSKEATDFIPKFRFFVRQNMKKIHTVAQIIESFFTKAMWSSTIVRKNDCCEDLLLQDDIVKRFQNVPNGSIIGGFGTFNEQKFFRAYFRTQFQNYTASNFRCTPKIPRQK